MLREIDSSLAERIGQLSLGQTIGNVIAGEINQSDNGWSSEGTTGATIQTTPVQVEEMPPVDGPDFDPALYQLSNAPVEVQPLPPIAGVNAENYNADITTADASVAKADDIETVVVTGERPLSSWQLIARFNEIYNVRLKLGIKPQVRYTPVYRYVGVETQVDLKTGAVSQITRSDFGTKAELEYWIASGQQRWQQYLDSSASQGLPAPSVKIQFDELGGETTGPNQVTIYASALDPIWSANGTTTDTYMNSRGVVTAYATYNTWEQNAVNTFFHEEWHALTWANPTWQGPNTPPYRNEIAPRIFAAQAVRNLQTQHGNLGAYILKLQGG